MGTRSSRGIGGGKTKKLLAKAAGRVGGFTESKVVNTDGSLKTVYHRTASDWSGKFKDDPYGIYFASSPSVVKESFGPIVKKANLLIKSPDPDAQKLLSILPVKEAMVESKSKGHDGWVIPIWGAGGKVVGEHYVVFSNKQIRSVK